MTYGICIEIGYILVIRAIFYAKNAKDIIFKHKYCFFYPYISIDLRNFVYIYIASEASAKKNILKPPPSAKTPPLKIMSKFTKGGVLAADIP
eukprot:232519_1